MNGEVKAYRLHEPMTWAEFKELPDDLKVMYIKWLRKKFDVSNASIAAMFGISKSSMSKCAKALGLGHSERHGVEPWDGDGWFAWLGGVKAAVVSSVAADKPNNVLPEQDAECTAAPTERAVEPETTINLKVPPIILPDHEGKVMAIPARGNMEFYGAAGDALETVNNLLRGANVHLYITWEPCGKECDCVNG